MTQYMSITEAATHLDVSVQRIYALVADGIVRRDDSRPMRVRATDVRAYAKSRNKHSHASGKRGGARPWTLQRPIPARREPEKRIVPIGFTRLELTFKGDTERVMKLVTDAMCSEGVAHEIRCDGWVSVGGP